MQAGTFFIVKYGTVRYGTVPYLFFFFKPSFQSAARIRNAHDEHRYLLCELGVFKCSLSIVF